jgi:hypothetical protein
MYNKLKKSFVKNKLVNIWQQPVREAVEIYLNTKFPHYPAHKTHLFH